MEFAIPIAVALIAIVVSWKVLKGLVKTAALVAIVIVAAIFVFGVHH